MCAGIAAGAVLLAIWLSGVEPWQRFGIAVLLYAPTPIQIYCQQYGLKIVSRLCLGMGISLAVSSGMFGYPWHSPLAAVNVGFLTAFLATALATQKWRKLAMDVPCFTCPEGRFPFCSWRHPTIQAILDEPAYPRIPEPLHVFLRAVDTELQAMANGTQIGKVVFVEAQSSGSAAGSLAPPSVYCREKGGYSSRSKSM